MWPKSKLLLWAVWKQDEIIVQLNVAYWAFDMRLVWTGSLLSNSSFERLLWTMNYLNSVTWELWYWEVAEFFLVSLLSVIYLPTYLPIYLPTYSLFFLLKIASFSHNTSNCHFPFFLCQCIQSSSPFFSVRFNVSSFMLYPHGLVSLSNVDFRNAQSDKYGSNCILLHVSIQLDQKHLLKMLFPSLYTFGFFVKN